MTEFRELPKDERPPSKLSDALWALYAILLFGIAIFVSILFIKGC